MLNLFLASKKKFFFFFTKLNVFHGIIITTDQSLLSQCYTVLATLLSQIFHTLSQRQQTEETGLKL